jgi:hypothetical protein
MIEVILYDPLISQICSINSNIYYHEQNIFINPIICASNCMW